MIISWILNMKSINLISSSEVEIIKDYIDKQHEHHKALTFQEEYRQILASHQMEFDEDLYGIEDFRAFEFCVDSYSALSGLGYTASKTQACSLRWYMSPFQGSNFPFMCSGLH